MQINFVLTDIYIYIYTCRFSIIIGSKLVWFRTQYIHMHTHGPRIGFSVNYTECAWDVVDRYDQVQNI